MNPQTRNLLIQRVIDSLGILATGSIFERFGVVLIERMQDVRLVQRGSSVGGSPVGGALDAVSENGRVVVEASIVKGYFSGAMKKPWGDLDHTLALAPLAEDIYLLSSQRAEAGVIEAMVNTALQEDRMSGRRLHLMDSRSIAEAIIDGLMLRDDAIDDLAQYLPILAEIRDDHPASLNAPPLNALYVNNETVDAELDRRLETAMCVEIGGIGGIGKSQAAAACLLRSESRFEYRFWVSGRDIDGVERLSSVPLKRGGAERNISALLRRNCTFLVVDDASPRLDVAQLAAMCGPNSRILITRQNPSPGAFTMPTMKELQARELLGKGLNSQPSKDEFQTIWRSVGGHPLSLAMLNAAAYEGVSWNELAEDCANVANLPVDGARLADRILGRLKPALGEELVLFQWACQSHCDRAFFKYVVGPLRLKAFERHGLTAPESEASLRIHDIVFTALNSLNWLTDEKARQIDGKLETFILQQIREDGHGLQLIASQLKGKIASNVEGGDRRPAFLYTLSMVWMGSAIQIHLLPNALEEARRLKSLGALNNEVAILVVLESIEAKERYLRQAEGDSVAVKWLGTVVQAYGDLAAMADLDAGQAAKIKHHHAKTLRGLGRHAEADHLFEEVVASHSMNDAKLQLIRSAGCRDQGYETAKQYASEIIAAKLNSGSVSPSLLMALGDALNSARQSWAGELIEQHEEMFLSEALYSAAIGIPQGYHSVASFVRAMVWHAPERVESLLARLPEPTPLMLDDDQSRGGYAEIMLLAAGDDQPAYLNRALEAFETLKAPNLYQARKWGETLYKLGRYAEAETIFETIKDSGSRIWLAHNMSQVKLELGKFDEALALVNESIAGATGVNKKYLSSFLLQRIKVKIKLSQDPGRDIAEGRRCTTNQGLLDQFSAF
ncbi:tetratricopeptide repeat protein [Pseudomonas cerasi]|uniref:tetratricopeptide repeat protein n=1 Tax=Pseudomonas cerasi TaxID=1583341 RepID=UPI0016553B31|nr:tetratricopeptide repeat protein [Pseudomonas cerasi]MBC8879493.1 tetratricopeptide repeat protein [Pseudomonas cerasi]